MTIREFLEIAALPMGKVLYVWGGGWEEAEGFPGVNPKWETFFHSQDASYDYRDFKGQHCLGLDCSGYVGWCVSNLLFPGCGKRGFVQKATTQAKYFSQYGFGPYIYKSCVWNHRPGDIMSTEGVEESHVYISLGECSDGSQVILHSTANGGVQLNGTKGEAEQLAGYYMEQCCPEWDARYHGQYLKPDTYLTDYGQMRWRVDGRGLLMDPEGYQEMKAEEVLWSLLGSERK